MKKHSQIREVSLDSIETDLRFQRPLNQRRVEAIAAEYHPEGIGILVVAHIVDQPAGSLVVIDGQTRMAGLRERDQRYKAGELSEPAPSSVLAEVYDNLLVEEAALLFRLRNFQTPVPVRERNRVGLTEGDPILTEVLAQTNKAGFTLISTNGNPPTMPHVDVGCRIVRWAEKYTRPDLLSEALVIQANAFGQDVGSVDKVILQVTADLMRKNDNLNEDHLTDVLKKMGASKILAQAEVDRQRFGKRLATMAASVLAMEYNRDQKRADQIKP